MHCTCYDSRAFSQTSEDALFLPFDNPSSSEGAFCLYPTPLAYESMIVLTLGKSWLGQYQEIRGRLLMLVRSDLVGNRSPLDADRSG